MHSAERVTLARLPSGVDVTTTVHTYEGAADGPTLYVQAAQHGREINGTEVLRRLHDELQSLEFAGRVVAVPVADPLTFDRVSYTTPEAYDAVNPNMNRSWPGDTDGSLHERMAATLWSYASDADAVVDLHTGSPDMLTHVVFREDDTASRDLAEAFGTELLLAERAGEDASEEWHSRAFGGKFRVAASDADIPAITPELAHNRQLVEPAIETGVTGLLNVVRHLDMLDDAPELGTAEPGTPEPGTPEPGTPEPGTPEPGTPEPETREPIVARNHLGRVTAAESGLFVLEGGHAVGDRVAAGEHVGTVYDPTTYAALQHVETDRAGILYVLCRDATVTAGQDLLNVALPFE